MLAVGAMATTALEVSQGLTQGGHSVKCVDPGWVIPISATLCEQVKLADFVVTIEDGEVTNGVGALLRSTLAQDNCFTPIKSFGIPRAFLPTDSRDNLLESSKLTPETILNELEQILA